MMQLQGLGPLFRLALRRDRVVMPVWILVIGGLTAGTSASIVGIYQTAEERLAAAAFSAGNPVLRIFDGPVAGPDIGSLVLMESHWLLAVLTALAVSQAVVRHTRAEEESGRAELVGAAVVGRHAPLAAGLLAAMSAAVGIGAGATLALIATGLSVEGSILTGASLTGVGLVFAGVAAVSAQVATSARAASGSAAGALGLAFLLRAVGDAAGTVADSGVAVVSAWPSWLSPIGWAQQSQPFATARWWALGLFALATLVLVVVAYVLSAHRDVGAGMLQSRPGPAVASPRLGTPLGLAWRLHRPTMTAWLVTLVVAASAFGSMGDSVDDLVGLSEEMRALLEAFAPGGAMVDLFFAFSVNVFALVATGFTVQTLLRMRSEEMAGRTESVLATPVSRHRYLASHAVIATAGAAVILVAVGLAGGTAFGVVTGDFATGLTGMVGAALALIPAVLVIAGVVLLAVAVVPRAAVAIGWGALAVSLVLGQLGAILDLPQAVLNVSPFTHVPAVPAQPLTATPTVTLIGVALVLTALAHVAFRRRDLATAA
ncbi:MAG: hypothetical protein WD358_06955 [Nitriliruptoraceae bacterium]